jgi:hypothetical protein
MVHFILVKQIFVVPSDYLAVSGGTGSGSDMVAGQIFPASTGSGLHFDSPHLGSNTKLSTVVKKPPFCLYTVFGCAVSSVKSLRIFSWVLR